MKRKIILTFILMFVIMTASSIYAATGSVSISSNLNKVIKGNTFTVTITGTADENITALQSGLEFDSTKLSLQGKTAAQGFTDLSGGDNEIAILSLSDSGLSKSLTLYTLTFKALDNATDGDTTITITNPELALINNNQEQINIEASNQSITIKIKSEEQEEPDDNNTVVDNNTIVDDNNTVVDNNTIVDDNNTVVDDNNTIIDDNNTVVDDNNTVIDDNNGVLDSNNIEDDKESDDKDKDDKEEDDKIKLPQTGLSIVGTIAVLALGTSAIISYRKYKNI